MATVALEKPGSGIASVLGGGKIGTSGTDFYIKVLRAQFRQYSPTVETTGDGDGAPTWENNALRYTHVSLIGAMIASQAIGLANLTDTTKNPSPALTFDFGGTRRLTLKLQIAEINIDYAARAEFVGLSMSGQITDTNTTEGVAS